MKEQKHKLKLAWWGEEEVLCQSRIGIGPSESFGQSCAADWR